MGGDDNSVGRAVSDAHGPAAADRERGSRSVRSPLTERAIRFISRRFSHDHHRGFHLTLGIGVILAAIIAFVGLAYCVSEGSGLSAFDIDLAHSLHQHARENPAAVAVFRPVTVLGS